MFKTKFKLFHATLVPIFPSCIKPIKRPWRFQSWAEQFLTNVHEAVSEVDQSNVQVMAHDKVLRPKIAMDNVALVKKAQRVRHLRCPKHKKLQEIFLTCSFSSSVTLVSRQHQMDFKDPISALIAYPSSPSRSSKIHEKPQSVAISITNGHSPVIQRSKVRSRRSARTFFAVSFSTKCSGMASYLWSKAALSDEMDIARPPNHLMLQS